LPPAVRVDAETAFGYQPFYLAVGEGAVWVPIRGEGTLLRIDPQTSSPVATIPIGDPARGGSFGSAPNPGTAASVVATNGFVWVTKEDERALAQVDPRTTAVVAIIPLSVVPHALAVGHGALWVIHFQSKMVTRIDPITNTVAATSYVGYQMGGIALDGDTAWVTSHTRDTLLRLTLPP
jgi:DNA-binding beta-propeller fold protein YncE